MIDIFLLTWPFKLVKFILFRFLRYYFLLYSLFVYHIFYTFGISFTSNPQKI